MPDEELAYHLRDAADTEHLGEVLGDVLRGASGGALLLLSGDLGAGKTTLVRGLAAGLGADPAAVASPTFTIRMDHDGTRPLVHIDAWRIGPDDLAGIGFDDAIASGAVVALEWPEKVASAIRHPAIQLSLEHAPPADDEGEPTRIARIDLSHAAERDRRRIVEAMELLMRAPRLSGPRCPACGAPPAGECAPFCSPRCRMADLGDWLAMRHRIEG